MLEACADYRAQECIQDKITTSYGDFSQAACRVNRWQDCLTQTNQQDCTNTDIRDCNWNAEIEFGNNTGKSKGVCLPKNSPGLQFWQGEETKSICAQANYQCIVTFEKGLFGGEKCVGNCECISDTWKEQRLEICQALGDCGAKINWIGQEGYKAGYNISVGNNKKTSNN